MKNNESQNDKTDYKDAVIRIKNQLGFHLEVPSNSKETLTDNQHKLIHIHAPYGMGKSLLLKDIKAQIDGGIKKSPIKRLEIFNTFIHNEEDFDNILSSNSEKDIDKIKTKKMHIFFWRKLSIILFNLLIALSIGMIPVYSLNIDSCVKAIPGFIATVALFPLLIWFWLKYSIRIKNNRVIVIENLDRHEWNLVTYILQNAHRTSRKYNIKFIFAYSMENLLERYSEKYGKVTNLYLLLDKYIEFEINLLKYSDSVKPVIIKEITKELDFGDVIEHSYISNYRLLKRTVDKIKTNELVIKGFQLDKKLLFYLEYLAISDWAAYEWIKKNTLYITQKPNGWGRHKWFLTDENKINEIEWRYYEKESKRDLPPIEVRKSLNISIYICNFINNNIDNDKASFYFIDNEAFVIAQEYKKITKGNSYEKNLEALSKNRRIPNYISFNYFKKHLEFLSSKTKCSFLGYLENFDNLSKKIEYILSIKTKELNVVELIYLWDYTLSNVLTLFPIETSYKYEASNYLRFSFFLKDIENFKQLKLMESSYVSDTVEKLFKEIKEYIIEIPNEIIQISKNTKFKYLYDEYAKGEHIPWEIYEVMIMSIDVSLNSDYNKVVELLGEQYEEEKILDETLFILLFHSEIDQIKDSKYLKNIFVLTRNEPYMKKKILINDLMIRPNFSRDIEKLSIFKDKYRELWK